MVRKTRKRGKGTQSMMEPISLNNVKPHQRIRAEELYRFLQNNPDCSRGYLVAQLYWADNENIRTPLRILLTEKRIGVRDLNSSKWKYFSVANDVAWSNRMVDAGKIEERKCKGVTKTGRACRVPDLYVREDGFCMHHGPDADKMKAKREETRRRNRAAGETNRERYQRQRQEALAQKQAVVVEPTYPTADAQAIVDAAVSKDGYLTFRIPLPKPDTNEADELRKLIKRFLDGDATTKDLLEATR
jgi:hypothetical protein